MPSLNFELAIAPTGRLRAVVNRHNSLLTPNPGNGDPVGLPIELAKTLAVRLGLELDLHFVTGASEVLAAVASASADIGFLAIDPARTDQVDFSISFVEIECAYLVRAETLRSMSEVDAYGIRVAVLQGSGPALLLQRSLKHATLVHLSALDDMIAALTTGEVEVVAGHRHLLEIQHAEADMLVVLPDSFARIEQAICIPKGRPMALLYINAFVREFSQTSRTNDR